MRDIRTARTQPPSLLSSIATAARRASVQGERRYCCTVRELTLDASVEKQWKQIGSDPMGLRLQVRFVKKAHGAKVGFAVADIRATIPEEAPSGLAIGPASGSAAAGGRSAAADSAKEA